MPSRERATERRGSDLDLRCGEDFGEDLLVALDGLPGAGAQGGAEVAQPAARRQHLPRHYPGHGRAAHSLSSSAASSTTRTETTPRALPSSPSAADRIASPDRLGYQIGSTGAEHGAWLVWRRRIPAAADLPPSARDGGRRAREEEGKEQRPARELREDVGAFANFFGR
jgi:hypothetical protein